MAMISAGSHVVASPEVFLGRADCFGDDALRVVSKHGGSNFVVVPRGGDVDFNVGAIALAAVGMSRAEMAPRRAGHKPNAGSTRDPENKAYLTVGYAALSPGLSNGALPSNDQDIDGVVAELMLRGSIKFKY